MWNCEIYNYFIGHIAGIGETRSGNIILLGELLENRPFERSKRR
jgi:hypothetical protein